MAKIIDCFIFYNELDLLSYRLNLLNDIVDYFVIVESTHTFIGKEKRLYFDENKHLFPTSKIIHIIVDDLPNKTPNNNDEIWQNEYYQRNKINRGIRQLSDLSDQDVIIISDVDEIPDPKTLVKIKKGETMVDLHSLEMDFYYYNLNTIFENKWYLCKAITFKKYNMLNTACSVIRNKECPIISNGGWHLSYFGDKYFIQNKIQNFSHQELNTEEYTNLDKIEERTKSSKDLYGRDINPEYVNIKDNTYLPPEYHKYLKQYYQ